MDIISQLIENKQTTDMDFKSYIEELILYEKLSRSKKFKHITESKALQKKLPLCWSAFQHNARAYFMLYEISTILQYMYENPLIIFEDLSNWYNKKEQTKLNIIGRINIKDINYYTYVNIDIETLNPILILSDKIDDKKMTLTIIEETNIQYNVYQTTLENKIDEPKSIVLTPYTYTHQSHTISIQTYSIQGNNDYPFAKLDDWWISMPTTKTITLTNDSKTYTMEMTPDEQIDFSFYKTDVEKVAKFLMEKGIDTIERG